MQFCTIYLETWGSTQPFVTFSTLDLRSFFFVFGGTNVTEFSYTRCLISLMVIQAAAMPGL
jgi:hypothetical protein